MEYTVKEMGTLSGVTPRTLRYYDEIGLLKPLCYTEAGYRIYGSEQAARLQQILLLRQMGLGLDAVGQFLDAPDFDRLAALNRHLSQLKERQLELTVLIDNVTKTIAVEKGEITMTDQERFKGLKRQMIEENESAYGEEIRKAYGDAQVDRCNARLWDMTKEQYDSIEQLTKELETTLLEAVKTGNPAGREALKACELHKQWLCYYNDNYTPEYHRGLCQLYVEDERFKAYYEKIAPGCASFLRAAVEGYLKE